MLRAGVLQLMSHTAGETTRAARGDDFPQVRALLERSDLPVDGVPENLIGYAVAMHDDKVVGVAGIERCDRYSLLRSVAVDESARFTGTSPGDDEQRPLAVRGRIALLIVQPFHERIVHSTPSMS